MSQKARELLDAAARSRVPDNLNLFPHIAAQLERKTFMQTLRTRPALMILLVLLALSLLTGVAYAIGRSLGYIPGVGLVEQGAPIRVLAEPVTQTRNGITLTVTGAVLTNDKTVILFTLENVPTSALSHAENVAGCSDSAKLRLPDAKVLQILSGDMSMGKTRFVYDPLPLNTNEVTFVLPCIQNTLPGLAPDDWQVPLRFKPAPPELTVAPVVELSTPVVKITPEPGVTSTPVLSNSAVLNGITFTLEKFVEVDGGYQLYGSLDLKNLSLPAQGYPGGMDLLTLTDSKGNRIPIEVAPSEPQDNSVYDPTKLSWIYRTNQKAFAEPLVLSLSSFWMEINLQTSFELELGPEPQIGQTWEINRDLDFNGHTIRLLSAKLIKSSTPEWASLLQFTYQDKEGGIFINVMDAVPQKPLMEVSGGGGGGGPVGENKLAEMAYSSIPKGLRRFTFSTTIPYQIKGPWQVAWNPPANSNPIPTPAPEACLTSQKWEQLKDQPEALPIGLGGKVLFTTDAMSPDINVFIANLDGSETRGLMNGYYPALSPDGRYVAFMSQDVGLNILNLSNGQTVSLGNGTDPVWSPDGSRILFLNPPEGLYVISADGSGLKKIETGSARVQPVGWLPDNQTIVFGAQVGDIYNLYEHVFKTHNLQTGETKSLFPITIKTAAGALSPDGQWIAFNARQFGANPDGAVFISRLDGSQRKPVAMLDNTLAYHPIWSPDGQWLIVSVVVPYKPTRPILVNPFTCQVIPLAGLNGEIQTWTK